MLGFGKREGIHGLPRTSQIRAEFGAAVSRIGEFFQTFLNRLPDKFPLPRQARDWSTVLNKASHPLQNDANRLLTDSSM